MTTTTDTTTYRLTISPDEYPDDPRECYDHHLGTMACEHKRYNLGDKDASINDVPEDAVCLNLYLLDHSGITMNTGGFSCSWDSGQVGYIYATREKAREVFGKDVTDEHIEKALIDEVKEYDTYLRGDIYSFILERREHCDTCKHDSWEHVDSCSGFVGDDYEKNGISEMVSEALQGEYGGMTEAELDHHVVQLLDDCPYDPTTHTIEV